MRQTVKRTGIMLCYPFEEKRLLNWQPPFIVQPKLDGVRCRALWDTQQQTYYLLSSTEHEIISVPHIVTALNKTQLTAELDGELYCHGMSFEEIYSRTSRTVELHPESEMIEFHIFDVIAAGDQLQRQRWVNEQQFCLPLCNVPVYIAETLDEIMSRYDQILNKGYEGIIVRNLHAPYVRKRSTFMMKFKPKKDDWYTVKGWSQEIDKTGELKPGLLGRLICAGDDGLGLPILGEYSPYIKPPDGYFSVGSGLTDHHRQKLWAARDYLAGSLCHVQYQHITTGKNVPRFPVFISVDESQDEIPDEVA